MRKFMVKHYGAKLIHLRAVRLTVSWTVKIEKVTKSASPRRAKSQIEKRASESGIKSTNRSVK
jgi:hypothetical protein